MKRFLCLFLAVGLLQSSAVAGNVGSAYELLTSSTGIELKLRNFESIHIDNGTFGKIEVGDTLRGIFEITSSSELFPGPGINRFPTGFELTGIFETKVLAVSPPDGFGNSLFEFGPEASFPGSIPGLVPAGTMIAFYEDFTPDFSGVGSAGSIAAAEALATDGTLFAAFGAMPGAVWGTDYYWNANGSATPGSVVAGTVATFAASLQQLYGAQGITYVDEYTQDAAIGTPPALAAVLGAIVNELALQGNVTSNRSAFLAGHPYPLKSQDPARLRAVPEPVSLMVWGLLTVGCVLPRRSRRVA